MIPENSSLANTAIGADAARVVEPKVGKWVFRRNCSLTPRQLLQWYASLCAITLVVATGFLVAGFWIVLPFAGLELLLVGLAFLVYARHAADYELIELKPNQLLLEMADGNRLTRLEWSPQWARLSYNGTYKAPLLFTHRGQTIKIGKFIAEKDKSALHQELRVALTRAAFPA